MEAGEQKLCAVSWISSKVSHLKRDHPWIYLWIFRFGQYFGLFLVIIILGILLFRQFNLAPIDIEYAGYFLSAMVQVQAAIVSFVVTLTLIAIQMAAASYTPRVVDVMKKNPDMWFLLFIYLAAISYGFIVLKQEALGLNLDLVSWVLIVGIYTFSILFLYMRNTIALLRPDKVVTMLVEEINTGNIHQEKWQDDIMQPVFDIVHASISRFDVTTTRTGLDALSDRVLELLPDFDDTCKADITRHFYGHIQRSALVALKNDDEGILGVIIIVLEKIGTRCSDNDSSKIVEPLIIPLKFIGSHAADKGLDNATGRVADALKEVGIHAADKGLDNATGRVAYALKEVGIHAADKGLGFAIMLVAIALKEVGIHAAEKGLDDATGRVAYALKEVGIHAADKGLDDPTRWVADALKEVGIHAAEKGLDDINKWVAGALEEIENRYVNENKN